ncbi:hypothetical protein AB4Z18_14955 [Leifsonia sp. 2TAF2]|uniref:hypothetical protein n=1 Tax=Leifsonia sp. 2TAF2 TaxID=3233009 RepID=UPI003F98BB32
MTSHGHDDPESFLENLMDELNQEVQSGVKGAQDWIEGQIHGVAVGLLHSMLPPLVHGNNAAVKTSESTTVVAASGVVDITLGSADFGNGVLAGAVADKVKQGIDGLRHNNDYTRGVNSIAW